MTPNQVPNPKALKFMNREPLRGEDFFSSMTMGTWLIALASYFVVGVLQVAFGQDSVPNWTFIIPPALWTFGVSAFNVVPRLFPPLTFDYDVQARVYTKYHHADPEMKLELEEAYQAVMAAKTKQGALYSEVVFDQTQDEVLTQRRLLAAQIENPHVPSAVQRLKAIRDYNEELANSDE